MNKLITPVMLTALVIAVGAAAFTFDASAADTAAADQPAFSAAEAVTDVAVPDDPATSMIGAYLTSDVPPDAANFENRYTLEDGQCVTAADLVKAAGDPDTYTSDWAEIKMLDANHPRCEAGTEDREIAGPVLVSEGSATKHSSFYIGDDGAYARTLHEACVDATDNLDRLLGEYASTRQVDGGDLSVNLEAARQTCPTDSYQNVLWTYSQVMEVQQ